MNKFKFAGMPRIEIPKQPNEITVELIKQYLPSLLKEHENRNKKADYLISYYEGEQDIQEKARAYSKINKFNYKGVENHAQYIVDYKKGVYAPMEFSYRAGKKEDDLKFFKNYLNDINFWAVENDVKEDMFTTGMAVTFCQIKPEAMQKDFDVDYESPFYYEKVSIQNNFVVYSSVVGMNETRLFAVNISYEDGFDSLGTKTSKKIYTIYTQNYQLRFKEDFSIYPFMIGEKKFDIKPNPTNYKFIPLIERRYNQKGIGAVEKVKDQLDLVNLVVSNSMDNIHDNANNIIVIKNTDLGDDEKQASENLQAMIDGGAIVIKSLPHANGDATVFTLYMQFDHDKINVFYEQRVKNAYAINGVPLPTQQTSSGGDTTGARELGGGYASARKIQGQEIVGMSRDDRTELKQMFGIAKLIPNSKIKEVHPNQIQIKYVINSSDNLLTKTQSVMNLYKAGVPIPHIVAVADLWGDEYTVAKEWMDAVKSFGEGVEPENQKEVNSENL